MGTLSCLSVADGDIEISFDTQNCAEAIRAKRIITDMLHRGYALLVKLEDGTYTRVHNFIEKQGTYIIADFDPTEETDEQIETKTETPEPAIKGTRGRKRKNVAMERSTVVAVAPSAGG